MMPLQGSSQTPLFVGQVVLRAVGHVLHVDQTDLPCASVSDAAAKHVSASLYAAETLHNNEKSLFLHLCRTQLANCKNIHHRQTSVCVYVRRKNGEFKAEFNQCVNF